MLLRGIVATRQPTGNEMYCNYLIVSFILIKGQGPNLPLHGRPAASGPSSTSCNHPPGHPCPTQKTSPSPQQREAQVQHPNEPEPSGASLIRGLTRRLSRARHGMAAVWTRPLAVDRVGSTYVVDRKGMTAQSNAKGCVQPRRPHRHKEILVILSNAKDPTRCADTAPKRSRKHRASPHSRGARSAEYRPQRRATRSAMTATHLMYRHDVHIERGMAPTFALTLCQNYATIGARLSSKRAPCMHVMRRRAGDP